MWPNVEAEVVCMDCSLLLIHQLRQLSQLGGHQADDEQFHVVYFRGGHVLPTEPAAYVSTVVKCLLLSKKLSLVLMGKKGARRAERSWAVDGWVWGGGIGIR